MKVGQNIVTCTYDSTVTQSDVNANQEDTGYLAVSVVLYDATDPASIARTDVTSSSPTPHVGLADNSGATKNGQVYGALATINPASGVCGVITTGVVPFRKTGASVAADVGFGIAAGGTNGQVAVVGAGLGRGQVVARGGNRLFVDLDANVNAVA